MALSAASIRARVRCPRLAGLVREQGRPRRARRGGRARAGRSTGRLHDFRRSAVAPRLHERFGVLPHVVEAALGHAGGHRSGVAGVYNRALYLDERRCALDRWGEHILTIVFGHSMKAKIVKLRRRIRMK